MLLSTYTIYIISLLTSFGRLSILLSFSIYFIWFVFRIVKNKFEIKISKIHIPVTIFSLVSYLLFLAALYPGIFTFHGNDIVMSAENWQDTAMHMEIIESISQKNFPPITPFFSSYPLAYYYFSDFHVSIIETLIGQFSPRLIVYINPIFISLFILSVYALVWTVFKSRSTAFFASILSSFYGNFMSVRFINDLIHGGNFIDLIAFKGYTIEYGKVMTISPMADYFLQNRPMMVGLPAFALILTVLYVAFKNKDWKLFLFAGLITSLMVKFQLFVILGVFAAVSVGVFFFIKSFKKSSFFAIGMIPGIFIAYLLRIKGVSVFTSLQNNFSFITWFNGKNISHIDFIFQNFGLIFILVALSLLIVIIKKIKPSRGFFYLFILGILLFVLPFIFRFTVSNDDMFKFFYLSIVPLSAVGAVYVNKVWEKNIFGKTLVAGVLIFSTITCLLNLGYSFLNKNVAYSTSDYYAGLWIRSNTPQKSIFVTMPTVHSAPTDIGGRLRVISYITWPYSEGFNVGADNVFSRVNDVTNVYKTGDISLVKLKYAASYVYYSEDERGQFPTAEKLFDSNKKLKLVYNQAGIKIYAIH